MSDSNAPDRAAHVAATAVPTDTTGTTQPAGAHAGRHDADRQDVGRRAEDRHGVDQRDVLDKEKREFGGMRFFLAFFGWLAATGTVVLLTALVTGVLAAIGVQNTSSSTASDPGTQRTAAIVSIAVLAFVLFVGYYVGGYVAGRMARFSGLKQGLAVWLWAVIVAVVVAILAAIAGTNSNAFSQLSTSGLPISGATASATGISSIIVAVVFSLAGALIGGLGGMRFHRKVDRFGRDA